MAKERLIEVMKDTRANAAWHRWGYEESADYLIANDVVPVVRCKDCKHYKPMKPYPSYNGSVNYCCRCSYVKVADNDFCSHGERKDK